MWKPLTIISGVLLAAAGGFNYVKIRPAVLAEKQHLENAENNYKAITTGPQGLDKAKEAKAAAEKAIADATGRVNTRTTEQKKADDELKAAQAALEEKKKEYDAVKLALDEQKKKLEDYGGLEVMAGELKSRQAANDQLIANIEATKNSTAAAVAHKAGTDKDIAGLQQRQLFQQSGVMEESFRARVSAVNTDFGFVMLPAGNNKNVVRRTKLDIKRGDTVVGKAVVTHVNPTTSIAEIIPGSVAAGDSVLPGDTVVVGQGSRPKDLQEAQSNTKAKPAAAPKKEESAVPADPFATPSDGTTPPADSTTPPADTTTPPADTTTPPADAATPPPATEAPPVEDPAMKKE